MKGFPARSATRFDPEEALYPTTDPDAMPENAPHLLAMLALVSLLRQWFRDRPEVFVIGDLFWYYEQGNPKARKAPDVMVVKGVEPHAERRRSFKDWKEKARPCFVLEVVSERTVDEDTSEKYAVYERLGVREYFLFDPEGEHLSKPLLGYRLIRGVYEELAVSADGSLPSSELGLRLRPEGESLALIDPRTGERLPDLPETSRLLEEVREELEQARQGAEQSQQEMEQERRRAEEEHLRAEQEHRRAEQERRRAEEEHLRANQARAEADRERQRAADLEAELAWLRASLPPPPQGEQGGAVASGPGT